MRLLDATLERAALVVGEVDGSRRADQGEEVGKDGILDRHSWGERLFRPRAAEGRRSRR